MLNLLQTSISSFVLPNLPLLEEFFETSEPLLLLPKKLVSLFDRNGRKPYSISGL
jgi:hypothetical protein